MTKENRLWPESEETAQKRIEQARSLKEQAKAGGLRFEPRIQKPQGVDEQATCEPGEAQYAQIDSQKFAKENPELAQIVANWSKLSDVHKRAIMAIATSR